jgi:hypothetical protein
VTDYWLAGTPFSEEFAEGWAEELVGEFPDRLTITAGPKGLVELDDALEPEFVAELDVVFAVELVVVLGVLVGAEA